MSASDKFTPPDGERNASAEATIKLSAAAFAAVMQGQASKGDVLAAARIAGIMAAKKAAELIPFCHPIALTQASVEFEPGDNAIRIIATVAAHGPTGVEMESLTAASVAALTLYDMIKSLDKSAEIGGVKLLAKSRGKTDYQATESQAEAVPRAAATRNAQGARPKPNVIMGEVVGPRPTADARREAFRAFMTGRRLRPTTWARDAGVHSGEILGFLTGRSRGFSAEVAEKLARAAKVRVEDMFK